MDEKDAMIANLRRLLAVKDKQTEDLKRQIPGMDRKIHDLESRLGLNPANSSRPPSADSLNSPDRRVRDKSGLNQGAASHPESLP